MDSASGIRAERDAVIADHGPWIAYNTHLGQGVHTRETGHVGTSEFMIHGLIQIVSDLSGKPMSELRILDLGSHEGGYAIELGLQGCSVVGIEGRAANVAKARFVAETLGLDRVEFFEDDVRNLDLAKYGRFDVVLCFGILYHLPAFDAVRLIERGYECCEKLTVVRTAIGLTPNAAEAVDGYSYRGRRYAEDVGQLGASLDNPTSILPSRISLLNLLADVGFTSVLEVQNPVTPGLDAVRDTVTLVAAKGAPVRYKSIEDIDQVVGNFRHVEHRGPSWVWQGAHPQQGLYWKIRERLTHTWVRAVFQSNRSVPDWLNDPHSKTSAR